MGTLDVSSLAASIARLIDHELHVRVERDALSAKLQDLLFGDRELWLALKQGIITLDEASQVVAAHLETWLEDFWALSADNGQRANGLAEIMKVVRHEMADKIGM